MHLGLHNINNGGLAHHSDDHLSGFADFDKATFGPGCDLACKFKRVAEHGHIVVKRRATAQHIPD